ncbi:hypothetical protein [Clostridium algoriphilum]|nr:hypothetical protein [Clostridium algoriphilum]
MLNSIKKFLSYFTISKDIDCSYTEDFDLDEEIFYYYYTMKL